MLGAAESEDHSLTMPVIIFEVTQTTWPQYFNVTDRRRDGQSTCHGNAALCIVR